MQVGSLSSQPPRLLPDSLRSICDGAEHGVVFVSLGTTSIQGEMQTKLQPACCAKLVLGATTGMQPADVLLRH